MIRGSKQHRRAQKRVANVIAVGVRIVRIRGSIGDGGIDSSGDGGIGGVGGVGSVSSMSVAAEALVALAVRPTWKHDCKRERRAGALGGTEESNDALGHRVDDRGHERRVKLHAATRRREGGE